MRPIKSQSAFSLVELIIVIVITGVLATGIATFITLPVQGFIDLSRRATLVYSAESALRRMQRDIRRALPNSIRVSPDGTAIEMISTVEAARFRAFRRPPPMADDPANYLTFNGTDTDFDILGNFNNLPATFPAAPFVTTTHRLAIYNIGQNDTSMPPVPIAGQNAYAGPDLDGKNVVTPNGRTITITDSGNEDHVNIGGGGFEFSFDSSASYRVYLVDGGISYICNGGQLTRYSGYNFSNAAQPIPPTMIGETVALMANNIGSCNFTYDSGTPARAGLMTLDLTVSALNTNGIVESVRLLHQVHVDNVP